VNERRISFRYRTNRPARISLDGGEVIECFVRDLSASGARLEVGNPKQVSEKFILRIEGMPKPYRCRVAWRTANMLGAEYL
jgi:PilZ domain